MQHFPRVWFAAPGAVDRFAATLPAGLLLADSPASADAVVLAGRHLLPAELPSDAGVVVLLEAGLDPDESVADLMADAGIEIRNEGTAPGAGLIAASAQAAAAGPSKAGLHPSAQPDRTAVAEDLLARVDPQLLRPAARLELSGPAVAVLRSTAAGGIGPAVAARSVVQGRRIVVLGVQIDDSAARLVTNAVTFAARRPAERPDHLRSSTPDLPAWRELKAAVSSLRERQASDGSIAAPADHAAAQDLVRIITNAIGELAPHFSHDVDYLATVVKDLERWSGSGFAVPDFLDSVLAFQPQTQRVDGREHLVLFPMYTQNGNPDRNVEAVLIQVIWPQFVAELEAADYSNTMFVPIRFLDFTAGYDTNSAVLFPETVAMREVPAFTWGAIFADREAARFRAVVGAAARVTGLALPPDAARLLANQELAEQVFVMWDLIHDRTHMHGDLPFDPFMIKQRMPYFLYTLEELRCDLTAFAESVRLARLGVPHAELVQYAILFDRIFRFPISGSRVRNYDGLGGQLLFAWLHQHHVLHWTDNRLSIDWSSITEPVLELGRQIEDLYWHSIDRPKIAHWLAAYRLVSGTVTPHPASAWAAGALPLDGPPKGLTDAVLPDEFPLSMFYEALNRKLSAVVAETAGITG